MTLSRSSEILDIPCLSSFLEDFPEGSPAATGDHRSASVGAGSPSTFGGFGSRTTAPRGLEGLFSLSQNLISPGLPGPFLWEAFRTMLPKS